jgi:hypothetical protein
MGNPPLIVGLLINGVAYAAIFIIVAFVISRFAGEFAWRSFLVLFLFISAGLYIVFAVRAGEGILWIVGEVVGVAIFGGMALLGLRGSLWWIVAGWALHPLWGRRAPLPRSGKIVRSRELHDRMPQFRSASRSLHRHQLRSRRTAQGPQKKPRLTPLGSPDLQDRSGPHTGSRIRSSLGVLPQQSGLPGLVRLEPLASPLVPLTKPVAQR